MHFEIETIKRKEILNLKLVFITHGTCDTLSVCIELSFEGEKITYILKDGWILD